MHPFTEIHWLYTLLALEVIVSLSFAVALIGADKENREE